MISDLVATSRHDTVDALLDAFSDAADKADIKAYFGCFHSAACRFLGTDPAENWTVSDFYTFAKPHFDKGRAWTYVPVAGSRKCDSPLPGTPGVVVFDELLTSKSFQCTCRGSGTAYFDTGSRSWFLLQYHLSFAIANDIAAAVCGVQGKFERKGSASMSAASAEEELLKLLALEDSANQREKPKKGTSKKK